MSDQVLAQLAVRRSLRNARLHEEVLDSLWFVPLCSALAAWLLSWVSVELDTARHVASNLTGHRGAYGVVAGTVAAAMLTFLGVVFSTTLVAVQLAASQYSPRIVRVFVRSRLTQFTLGVFLATFVFSLASLFRVEASNEKFVPRATLLCLFTFVGATVLMFVAYIHGMVRLLRVQYLLRVTAQASHNAVDHAFPDAGSYRSVARPQPSINPRPVRNEKPRGRQQRGTPRILQAVDVGGLAAAAAASDSWVEICVSVGAHAGPGVVVAKVHGPSGGGLTHDEVRSYLLFGSERTLLQDPAFGIRQLVDTASRALSPASTTPPPESKRSIASSTCSSAWQTTQTPPAGTPTPSERRACGWWKTASSGWLDSA